MTRREQIVRLLEQWADLQAAPSGSGNQAGNDPAAPLQPHDKGCGVYSSLRCTCWLRSVAELDTLLRLLRHLGDGRYRHLEGRYGQATRVRRRHVRYRAGRWERLAPNEAVLIPRFEPGQRGSSERVYDDVLIATWPAWVRLDVVEEAITWLERTHKGPLQVPVDRIREAA